MATSNKTVSQNDCFGQLVKGREPWYLHRQHSSSTKSLLEIALIAPSITLEDPMTSIRRHQSRKEQSRKYTLKATSTSDKRSIDELRRERLEREQREQKRVNDLLGHHTPVVKEENVPYHTQYHPELSRDRHVKRHYNNTTYRSSIRRHNNDNEYDDDRDDDRRSRHRHHRSKYGRPY
ncbi:hypothetical protein BDF22DRAFT_741711 [Syncephalis plumigaleata]|nr:hypothetical protein BDF22DRAFT_741711 [Syncephalis plumigaleata]